MKKRLAHTCLFITVLIFGIGCSNSTSENADSTMLDIEETQNIPEPRSKMDHKKSNEALAPQTCYYGCKASK